MCKVVDRWKSCSKLSVAIFILSAVFVGFVAGPQTASACPSYEESPSDINPGDDWLAPTTIFCTGSAKGGADIATDKDGDAVAVWTAEIGSYHRIQAAYKMAGQEAWCQATTISPDGTDSRFPTVAIDDSGYAVVAYLAGYISNGGKKVAVQTKPADSGCTGWGSVSYVKESTNDTLYDSPYVAVDSRRGAAVVIWEAWRYGNFDAGSDDVYMYGLEASSSSGRDSTFTEYTNFGFSYGDISEPKVVVDSEGLATAVWREQLDTPGVTQYMVRSSSKSLVDSSWSDPGTLSTGLNIDGPDLAIDGQGRVTALWFTDINYGYIQSATKPKGDVWEHAINIPGVGSTASQVDLSVNRDGDAAAVWQKYDSVEELWRIGGSTKTVGSSTWNTANYISDTLSRPVDYLPKVTATDNYAVAVWEAEYGDSITVQSSRFFLGGGWGSSGNISEAVPVDSAIPSSLAPDVAALNDDDAVSLWNSEGTMRSSVFDGTYPDTTIDSKPSDPSSSDRAEFTFSSSEPNSTFECLLDGEKNFSACDSPVTYENLPNSSHTFRVRAIDAVNNVDATPATYTWKIDVTPPETTIISGPDSQTSSKTATFKFKSSDAESTFACSLDPNSPSDMNWKPCGDEEPSNAGEITYESLGNGDHTFYVRAISSGSIVDDTPAEYSWTVKSVPNTTIYSAPDSINGSSGATFQFGSSADNSTFECGLDPVNEELIEWSSCESPKTYKNLSEGTHTFYVRAFADGETDPTPAKHTWTIDLTSPQTTIDSWPEDPTSSTNAVFEFSSNETGSTFECSLDPEDQDAIGWSSCDSPITYSNLDDGSHKLYVRAVDAAKNSDPSPDTYSWRIDSTPPETTILTKPSSQGGSTATFSFTSSENGTFECKLVKPGDSSEDVDWSSCDSPITYGGLEDGDHQFYVRATDSVGNTDPTPAGYEWTVNSTLPQTTIDSGPDSQTVSRSATFTFSSSVANSTFECKLDLGPWEQCVSPKTYGMLNPGSHTFSVKAIDPDGKEDPSPSSYAWTIVQSESNVGSTGGGTTGSSKTESPEEKETTDPELRKLRLSMKRARASSLKKGKKKLYIRINASAETRILITIRKKLKGCSKRKSKKSKNRCRKGKRVARFTRSLHAGGNRVKIPKKYSKRLSRGTYTFRITVSGSDSGKSRVYSLRFKSLRFANKAK